MPADLILGLNIGHSASAALMRDGVIVAAALEERFSRVKNAVGYPTRAIAFCLRQAGVRGDQLSAVAIAGREHSGLLVKSRTSTQFSLQDYHDYYGARYYQRRLRGEDTLDYLRWLNTAPQFAGGDAPFDFSYLTDEVLADEVRESELFRREVVRHIGQHLGVPADRISYPDHHTCHAYYAYFASPFRRDPCVILTMDGWGDGRNQTVWEVSNDQPRLIAESNQNDLARIYKMATLILAMRPDEHEFKVMGLAPYAKPSHVARAMTVLDGLLQVDGMRVVHHHRPADLYATLRDGWRHHRFDNIAGAVQAYTERIATTLVRNIVRETGIPRMVLSGGVAMNVKMNKAIAELDDVADVFVCGSGGDESLSLGACYVVHQTGGGAGAPVRHLYLGSDISDEWPAFQPGALADRFTVTPITGPALLADRLMAGDTVAVARGRAEFGARALGNRSILAHPGRRESVQRINEAIKNRDFWMPFALSILEERHQDYLHNPKHLQSPFMAISLDARAERYAEIEAGSHPYDRSVRPQFVSREHAPAYHALIAAFATRTGTPAVLNTSFNLHGEPIVDTISDAVRTFEHSGLDHLAVDDRVLLSKRPLIS